jgi:copper chaperone
MKNTTLKFKTNIKCMGCVAKVTPELEKQTFIANWNVDVASPDKILTVEASTDKENEIIKSVEQAGFKIEKIDS